MGFSQTLEKIRKIRMLPNMSSMMRLNLIISLANHSLFTIIETEAQKKSTMEKSSVSKIVSTLAVILES